MKSQSPSRPSRLRFARFSSNSQARRRASRRTFTKALLVALPVLLLTLTATHYLVATAQQNMPGALDPTFGEGGKVTSDLSGNQSEAYAVAILPDRKILVGGYAYAGSSNHFALARYLGAADPTPTPTPTPPLTPTPSSTPACPSSIAYTVSSAEFTLAGDSFFISGTGRVLRATPGTPVNDVFRGGLNFFPANTTTPSGEYTATVSQTISFEGIASVTLSYRFVYTVTSDLRRMSVDMGETKTVDLGARGKIDVTVNSAPNFGQIANNSKTVLVVPASLNEATFLLRDVAAGACFQFSADTYTVAEGAGSASVTVTRTGNTSIPASVEYATAADASFVGCDVVNGNASERCDFTTTLGTLRFAAGEESKTIRIFITDDAYVEGAETFTISLLNPTSGSTLGTPQVTAVVITDNDTTQTSANPIDNSTFFVRMHYVDFLNREGEPAGVDGWVNSLDTCPRPADPFAPSSCDRVEVSSRFFRSVEFMLKGNFVIRFYRVSLGRNPGYREFTRDSQRVTGATAEEVFANRDAFTGEWVQRADFRAIFDGLSNQEYVDKLEQTAGVTLSNKSQLVADLNSGAKTRAQVLREVVESNEVRNRMYNDAFVLMEYFGYLRRDAEPAGFNAWLAYLNAHPNDYRTMVRGFINSVEYRKRFGDPGPPQPGEF
ncbi:MAG TPA: Calx-beta domain-containing protein [Pyrinomonadaceae bacterium]|nr:Calx-beta domain-containing protein [Pyrinomonadaceae bacterium]